MCAPSGPDRLKPVDPLTARKRTSLPDDATQRERLGQVFAIASRTRGHWTTMQNCTPGLSPKDSYGAFDCSSAGAGPPQLAPDS